MRVTICIPTYNEQENIGQLIREIKQVGDYDILVVDDGKDATEAIALKEGAVVIRGQGKGLGQAIIDGINYAKTPIVLVMDADLSHPTSAIPRMIEPLLNGYDMTVGSRYVKGGKTEGWELSRRIISRCACLLALPITTIKDSTSGFFAIRKEILDGVKLEGRSWKTMLEVLIKAKPLRVLEVPITFKVRQQGKSKFNRKQVVAYLKHLVALALHKYNRFLRFCIVGGSGALITFALTWIFTEVAGLWYMASMVIAVAVATVTNFIFNSVWTFSVGKDMNDADYEWNAYYAGNFVQKWWKRSIAKNVAGMLPTNHSHLSYVDVGCFPKGTRVLVEKGKVSYPKKIEDIKVGDKVLSYDERTGNKEEDSVVDVFHRVSSELLRIKFSNGNEIICTPEHPIFVAQINQWITAQELQLGQKCVQKRYNGYEIRLSSLSKKGKTNIDIFGEDKAKAIYDKESKILKSLHLVPHNKGLKLNQYIPQNKINEVREKIRNGRKGVAPPRKGLSYESYYGKEIASILKRKCGGRKRSEDERRRISNSLLGRKNDGHSQFMKDKWKDIDFARKTRKAQQLYPSSAERGLINLISEVLPNEYEYNGDGRLGLSFDGLSPDFVNTNGKKKVIEMNGCCFHCCPICGIEVHPRGEYFKKVRDGDKRRLERINKLGYEVLVVWEHELKDPELLKRKVLNFTYNPDSMVVDIVKIERLSGKAEDVYNIKTKKNNNYFAYGILVHNCGSSPLALQIGSQHYVGVDENIKKVQFMRSRLPNYTYECFLDTEREGKFDVAMAIEVIEHMPDLQAANDFIKQLTSKVKIGGIVILATPDYSSLTWKVIEKIYGILMPSAYADDHKVHYDENTLICHCKLYGLQHIKTERVLGCDMVCQFRKVQ